MRWKGRRQSSNVEDRRSMRGPVAAGGGIVGVIVVLLVIVLGGDPEPLLKQMQQNNPGGPQAGLGQVDPAQDEAAQFVSVVLADTEEGWTELFRARSGTPRAEAVGDQPAGPRTAEQEQ